MKYLDPKADLTFKKVFGEHPDLVKSLLNALLPFKTPDEYIVDIEYLPSEMVPDTPFKKNSIVDVRCRDQRGRLFIVEMQMLWSSAFMQRVLFNASKAYVRQLGGAEKYELLQPVYSLNLVDDVFMPDVEKYYHDYRIVHMEHSDKVIEGLRFIFVELPKFTPHTYTEKKMQALWLRFLTEIDGRTREIPQELLDNPEIKKAVDQIEQSAFNDAQLLGYDEFWDAVRVEKTLVSDALKEGMEKGLAEGMEKGMEKGMKKGMAEGRAEGLVEGQAKGRAEGERNKQIEIARKMKQAGMDAETIARLTGLATDDIDVL
ncbi:Rpn family recombination-promoting nuclease/putative transposase [Phocaeicola salanitronis]|uniref:Rpn family recombination-promoting nuclease/putative transposase n=1 Tax=Phocaeicola salanitronis TaxID=376805 RepID=UPI0025A35560|nr:Rpn family recombination-promoting nuclease/putative transposase [Phocaeicola salanitronis]MDM8305018.1 Rpn family recombination-promoting nuclease/putative transposase [Phocaeicola salanitronis]